MAYQFDLTIAAQSETLTDFPVAVPFGAAVGLTDFDTTDVFDTLPKPQAVIPLGAGNAPVSRWDFDNISGSTLTDLIGSDDGTITNMTDTAGGPFDRYLAGGAVDSVARNVDLGSDISFKAVSLWVKAFYIGETNNIIGSNSGAGLYLDNNGDLRIWDGSSPLDTGHNITNATTWHHIVIVEGSDDDHHYVYMDGSVSTEITSNMGGGFRYFGRHNAQSNFNSANITNIQRFDFKLTAAQVTELYEARPWKQLIFKDAADNQLYAEVEQWDVANEKALIHVKATLGTSETVITCNYDPSNADQSAYIGTAGDTAAQSVWNSGIWGRYGGSVDVSGDLIDSTSNERLLTTGGDPVLTDGEFGKAQQLDGTGDYFKLSSDPGLGDFTITTKFKPDAITTWGILIAAYMESGALNPEFELSHRYDSDGDLVFRMTNTVGTSYPAEENSALTADVWHVATAKISTNAMTLYLDGIEVATATFSGTRNTPVNLTIGARDYGSGASNGFAGLIEETIIESTARSATWIAATTDTLTDALITFSVSSTPSASFSGSTSISGSTPIPPTIVRNLVYLNYDLMASVRNLVYLPYGIKLAQLIDLNYSDLPVVRQRVDLLYWMRDKLKQKVDLEYGDLPMLRQAVDLLYEIRGSIRNKVDLRYHIINDTIRQLVDMSYDIQIRDEVRNTVSMLYSIISGETIEEATTFLVVKPDSVATRGYTGDVTDGYNLSPFHVDVEKDEDTDFINIELLTYLEDDFEQCPVGTTLQVQINTDEYTVKVRKATDKMDRQNPHYSIICDSPGYLLSFPHASPVNGALSGMAQTVVNQLVDLEDTSMTVTWSLIDWLIPADVLTAENQSPLELIKQIVETAGGIVQFDKSGNMECRPKWPDNLWEIDDDSMTSVDAYYNAADDIYEIDSEITRKDGFNNFFITDQTVTADGLQIMEVEEISEYEKRVKVSQIPFNNDTVRLRTSGGSWVAITNEGVRTEVIGDDTDEPELIEIVDGSGNTRFPVYAVNSSSYKETNLGAISFSEDGTITTATENNSQVEMVYTTQYYSWRVRSDRIETVQFWPEII